ncbi:unnamed protein product [Diplocarpon coronariae]
MSAWSEQNCCAEPAWDGSLFRKTDEVIRGTCASPAGVPGIGLREGSERRGSRLDLTTGLTCQAGLPEPQVVFSGRMVANDSPSLGSLRRQQIGTTDWTWRRIALQQGPYPLKPRGEKGRVSHTTPPSRDPPRARAGEQVCKPQIAVHRPVGDPGLPVGAGNPTNAYLSLP